MAAIDLVFEGGGAKGMVFVGALEELFRDGTRTHGRLLGTSAGAITAVSLAAGYTPAEMLAALTERDADGKPVFVTFLGMPAPFDAPAIHFSAIRQLLAEVKLPGPFAALDDKLDDWLAGKLAGNDVGCHVFSFVDRGGWFGADAFVTWLRRKLNQGEMNGKPRQFGDLTFQQFFDQTGVELTLVASDTTDSRMLLLNHRTAPDCPVVWGARMSMSVPLLWQEVIWQKEWGCYAAWDGDQGQLVPQDIAGHAIVDGGLLSNFPIALFVSRDPDIQAVMGPANTQNVIGMLIDETLPVPNHTSSAVSSQAGFNYADFETYKRLHRLMNTALSAHDNMAISVFKKHVVRLPAQGYGTTQFDMSDKDRDDLVAGGRSAMHDFLRVPMMAGAAAAGAAGPAAAAAAAATAFAVQDEATLDLANDAAKSILQH